MIIFDANELMKEMALDYSRSRENEKRLRETLKKLGFKNHSYCGQNMLEKTFDNSGFFVSLVSFNYTCGHGYSIDWSLGLKSNNDSLRYIYDCREKKENYLCGIINYVLTGSKTTIFESTRRWSANQLQYGWLDSQYDEMIEYLQSFIKEKETKYLNVESIIFDLMLQDDEEKALWLKHNKIKPTNSHIYDMQAILYIHFCQIEKSIHILEKSIECEKLNITIYNLHLIKRKEAYLEHLKYGTLLPYIPFPNDTASIFNLTGEDIYVVINKKAIKDIALLEYFIPKESFAKPKKVAIDDSTESSGIIISKLGKWSILRISFDVIQKFQKDKMETILQTLSSQYTQAILFVNQDTTATFGFEMYKKGELLRKWMSGDGEVLENIGKPLKNEKKLFLNTLTENTDEQSITSFLDTILKITQSDLDNSKSLYYELK